MLFNALLHLRKVPTEWKKALAAPLFKKRERAKPANYRPVSLTCICCKILEHVVHHHIITDLEELNILSEAQHSFCKDRSCESQLILTIQDLASGLEEGGQIDDVLLDFSKAFDKVPHQRLRLKLEHYGVRGESLDWISSFLSERSQGVVCGGSTSGECEVASGVPQGSVLRPLLLLVYINDLPEQVRSTTRLSADDCLLYRKINSLEDTSIIQDDLVKLQQWEDKWLMCFSNPDILKCEILRVTAKKNHSCLITTSEAPYYLWFLLQNTWESPLTHGCLSTII